MRLMQNRKDAKKIENILAALVVDAANIFSIFFASLRLDVHSYKNR